MIAISAGFQTSAQDLGRFGFRKFGVATSGALDPAALRLCNLLVGNEESAAGLEFGAGRATFRMADERLLAWSGGDFEVRAANQPIPALHCARAPRETVIELRPRRPGRAWLAISGGVEVTKVLGSRSTDLRAGFGGFDGRLLRDGDVVPLGEVSAMTPRIKFAGLVSDWSAPVFPANQLRVVPGKDWSDEAGGELLQGNYRVAMNSDRMGLRLEGVALPSVDAGELISEPVCPGTVQLPRGGAPIVLLADCQTIGGYPRIAHVISVDLSTAAQLQPHDMVRFTRVTAEFARQLVRDRERDIALFRAGLQARF